MKKILLFATLLFSLAVSARRVTVPKNADGGWYYSTVTFPASAGDTVVMTGDYSYINIGNVTGSVGSKIVFLNSGLVRVGYNASNYSWIIAGDNWVIDGTGTNGTTYGFKVGNATAGHYAAQGVTFFGNNTEMHHIEIANAQVGFFSASPTLNGSNIYIHHCYVHNLDNPSEQGRSEAFYLGNTGKATTTTGGKKTNVEIANNTLANLAGDGIQIALTENVNIHDNTINGYGGANLEQQRTGIIIGGCTSGIIKNNTITNGTGAPFQCFGGGDVYYEGNVATNVATTATEDGFYIAGLCTDGPLRVHLKNNAIDHVARDFLRVANTNATVVESSGNSFGTTIILPPPVDTTTPKVLLFTIRVYTDKSVSKAKALNKKKTVLSTIKVYTDGTFE